MSPNGQKRPSVGSADSRHSVDSD